MAQDLSDHLDELPFPYATALRLAHAGASEEMIAAALAIEPEGVLTVMQLARAKLAAIDTARDPSQREAHGRLERHATAS